MYIHDLKIQNLKLLRDFHLSFGSREKLRMWTVLVGENGMCKTAILRSIALAATGHTRGNQLADASAFPDRRLNETTVRIEAQMTLGGLRHGQRLYPGLSPSAPPTPPHIESSIYLRPGDTTLRGSSSYFPNSYRTNEFDPESPSNRITFQELREHGVVEELARVFDRRDAAYSLLDEIDFPSSQRPPFETSYHFWRQTATEIEHGIIHGGLGRLLAAAAAAYPGNPIFGRWVAERARKTDIDPIDIASTKNVKDWFVAGYGTSRLLPRPLERSRPQDPCRERLRSLFDQGSIVGTGFASFLKNRETFTQALRRAFVDLEALPAAMDIELKGRNWAKSADDIIEGDLVTMRYGDDQVSVPTTWLSQGYQSTIAWIADIVGQFFFEREKPVPFDQMEGLVLIDEIDLHLHPKWQAALVPIIKKIFPRIQFVVTTHSPMILPGLKQEEIVLLRQDEEGNIVAGEAPEAPALLTGSQIYNEFFGIRDLFPTQLGLDLQRYSFLVGMSHRNAEDDREMEEIRGRLSKAGVDPGWDVMPTRGGKV